MDPEFPRYSWPTHLVVSPPLRFWSGPRHHVLSKINRVSFGIMNKEDHDRAMADTPNMPLSRVKLAIPFEGKDVPSRASEFAHPDTIIGLSILAAGPWPERSARDPVPLPRVIEGLQGVVTVDGFVS